MANIKHKDAAKPFIWKHAVGNVILWVVTWYSRYGYSYRDLKEIADQRWLKLDHSNIYCWVQEYVPEINKRIRPYLKATCDSWKDKGYLTLFISCC